MAKLGANLYFVMYDLPSIEPVYEFSLDFFKEIYEKSIESAPPGRNDRIKNINNSFCYNFF